MENLSVRRPGVGCIAWLGVWCGFAVIVLCAARNRELSIIVIDVDETASANPQLLCEPRLYDNDEVVANNLSDTACERSKRISARHQRNLESEPAVDEFHRAFE